jgi:hypothetical protein
LFYCEVSILQLFVLAAASSSNGHASKLVAILQLTVFVLALIPQILAACVSIVFREIFGVLLFRACVPRLPYIDRLE